jgi:ABC-type dipeptide/oligopeptide/nickel transport system permease component
MPPLLKFILRRLFFMLISFIVITALLYAGVMLIPPETRAELYMPKNLSPRITEEQIQNMIDRIIEHNHLNAPYPVQYISWLGSMLRGTWGYSPTLQEDVLASLLRRTPATLELTLYSFLVFMPLGILSGVIAAKNVHHRKDSILQVSAFIATAIPVFILALFLISIFYAGLHWFPPGRVGLEISSTIREETFHQYTGLLTIDGLLNGRLDVTLDAFRHLVLPVFTLSLYYWATVQRVTRAAMMDEFGKEYLLAVQARGIPLQRAVWHHALRNALSPVLTSSMLSAAALLTGVFVVEIIYNYAGVSYVLTSGIGTIPDAPAAVGFAVYSILVVLILMFILDVIQAWLDPRYREGLLEL